MEENISESKNGAGFNNKVLIIGCSLLACIILSICLITFTVIFRQQIPVIKNYFPTVTPIPTPTSIPHILVHAPSDNTLILKDDFTTNQNDWSAYYIKSKIEVRNGKLAIESFEYNSVGIAECFCKSPADLPITDLYYADTYYLQADVSTEKWTTKIYGLAFGLDKAIGFYEFSVNPIDQVFYLQKSLKTGWANLTSGSSKAIKPYPDANTLSVYFDHGTIELFINGEKVATYIDENPISKGKIGFIANDFDFKLLVDNLFVYNGK